MSTGRESAGVAASYVDRPGTSDGRRRRAADPLFRVHVGDARRLSERLRRRGAKVNPDTPDAPFLTATITSPPYAALVDYGIPD